MIANDKREKEVMLNVCVCVCFYEDTEWMLLRFDYGRINASILSNKNGEKMGNGIKCNANEKIERIVMLRVDPMSMPIT